MFCPICGNKIEEGIGVCSICGYTAETVQENLYHIMEPAENTCPNCGYSISEGDTVCPICSTAVTYVAPVVQEMPESTGSTTLSGMDEVEEKTSSKSNSSTLLMVSIICLVLVVGGFLFWFLKNQDKKQADKENVNNEITKTNVVKGEAEELEEELETGLKVESKEEELEEPLNVNAYVGYWNIANDSDKELTIHSGNEKTVYFSLWYYRLDSISNVKVKMEGNTGTFSTNAGGSEIRGILTFEEDSITLQITHSKREHMPVCIMEFTERHGSSWEYGTGEVIGYEYDSPYFPSTQEYILPYSSQRLLTYEDIYFLTPEQLKLARNEIYARNGRLFKDQDIQRYFDSQSWYYGRIQPDDFQESMLTQLERDNVQFIMSYEKQ